MYKKKFSKQILIHLLLSMFFMACSAAHTTSVINKENDQLTIDSTNSNRIDSTKIIKAGGWRIPSPRAKVKEASGNSNRISENGLNIEVTSTAYVPKEKFIYKEEPFDANPSDVSGDLELKNYTEIRINENIFAYVIYARNAKTEIVGNTSHNHTFVYEIVDNDGDGIFETLLYGGANLVVPRWAAR